MLAVLAAVLLVIATASDTSIDGLSPIVCPRLSSPRDLLDSIVAFSPCDLRHVSEMVVEVLEEAEVPQEGLLPTLTGITQEMVRDPEVQHVLEEHQVVVNPDWDERDPELSQEAIDAWRARMRGHSTTEGLWMLTEIASFVVTIGCMATAAMNSGLCFPAVVPFAVKTAEVISCAGGVACCASSGCMSRASRNRYDALAAHRDAYEGPEERREIRRLARVASMDRSAGRRKPPLAPEEREWLMNAAEGHLE